MDDYYKVLILPVDPIHNETTVSSTDSLTAAIVTAIWFAKQGDRVIVRDVNGETHYRTFGEDGAE